MATVKPKSNHLQPTNYYLPLVVIVGPTASGKTSLAIDMAKQYNGEIICADSRSIYKGADIGTAKPSSIEQAIVPHWGLDLVEPGQYFSVADFKVYTDKKIIEIRSRRHIPFLVGGTGLYIDAVLFDYKFGLPADVELRSKLQHMTINELHDYCEKNSIPLPENYKNKRYVIRAIENKGIDSQKNNKPLKNSIIVGIATDKEVLRTRIACRTEQLFESGVVNEAKTLGDKYGWDNEAMKSNIYPLIRQYISDKMTIGQIKEKFIILDWRLAKRQLTWLRRNRFIQWFSIDDAIAYLSDKLAINK
jgi:tRNA dimethylallyltransferase